MIIRYQQVALEKPIAPIVSGQTMADSFLASDGYVLERDMDADPTTIRIAHPRGLAVHHVPWSRVIDSQEAAGAKEARTAPTPAALRAPEEAPAGPPPVTGALSEDSREALERDGIRVAAPTKKKGGWPSKKASP